MDQLQSLDNLYTKRIFRIPDYQRGYAWGTKQLVDFWEDLLSLDENRSHYTGVISIKKVPREKWERWAEEKWLIDQRKYTPYFVVDGQQRLTTASILLQCILEKLESIQGPEEKDKKIYLNGYALHEIKTQFVSISQPPDKVVTAYKFGYEQDNPSFEYLRYRIYNEEMSGEVNETFYTLKLENAKAFFQENLDKVIAENGREIISEIFVKLTQRFLFNLYELKDDFDVFVAFETMNNRGKSLSDLELLKNRLIYLTTLYKDDEVDAQKKLVVRAKINEVWKQVYFQLGRNKEYPLNDDDFLKAHWIMYFRYSRKKGNDYINNLLDEEFSPKNVLETVKTSTHTIQEVVTLSDFEDESEEDFVEEIEVVEKSKLPIHRIDDYVKSLKNAAKFWYTSYNPATSKELTSEERKYLDKLNRIGIIYFRPLVMASFCNPTIESEERVKLLKAIERFIFINFRLSRAMSNHRSSHYYNAARELYKGNVTVTKLIQQLEWDMSYVFNSDGTYKFNYFTDYIEKRFSSNGSGFYGWNSIRYFLYEYEEGLMEMRNQRKLLWQNFVQNKKDQISIEHILPQTPTENCWKNVTRDFQDGEIKYLKGTLGNLLPLSKAINSSLQNVCFSSKKETVKDEDGNVVRNGYANGSYSEQEVASLDNWTSAEIFERGMRLLKFMEERWDIKFASDTDKIDLLHLQFLVEQEQTVEE